MFLRCSLKKNWIVILLIWERVNDEECRLLRCSRKLHKSHVIVLPAPTGGSHTAVGPGEGQTRSVELFRALPDLSSQNVNFKSLSPVR